MSKKQKLYSPTSHAVLDIKSRKEKASVIINILGSYKDLKKCRILDIGTGSGVIDHEIGRISKNVYSVDIRDERVVKKGFAFKKIKDEKLPFGESEFDIVMSNHVMAHVKNQDAHLKEISRVLKSDGIVYLSMLNRLCVMEPNFSLPFLSWLPKKLADRYVRFSGRGKSYDVRPNTYREFVAHISQYFDYKDMTLEIIKRNVWMPKIFYGIFKPFSPVWIFILRKK